MSQRGLPNLLNKRVAHPRRGIRPGTWRASPDGKLSDLVPADKAALCRRVKVKKARCKFGNILRQAILGIRRSRQFHGLASDEKSIDRWDIIRRCTMGNKLRNYHTKRLPPAATMGPNRGPDTLFASVRLGA
ncbi:hypothetical protein KM043_002261 [Ampulex compressa]|nr:hypothetical protein KM043_002261 [Ampulex compressa]